MLGVVWVGPKHADTADLLSQTRLHLALCAHLREERLPHLRPARGRVAVHPRAGSGAPEAFLSAPTLYAEEHRARLGREQPREEPRDLSLLLEREKMEEGAEEDGGKATAQFGQSRDGRERRGSAGERGGGGGQERGRREEGGVENVTLDEGDRE